MNCRVRTIERELMLIWREVSYKEKRSNPLIWKRMKGILGILKEMRTLEGAETPLPKGRSLDSKDTQEIDLEGNFE